MLDTASIDQAVARLDAATSNRAPIRQLTLEHPSLTFEDAYAIQGAWKALQVSRGRRVIGHKVGLTSRARQIALNIDEPDFGVLLDDMLFADGADIPMDRFIAPSLEVELAFVLQSGLRGPNCSLFDVLSATAYVTPALEILDARIHRVDPETRATRTIVDAVADNSACAGIVLGGRPFQPGDVDMRWVAALCYRNARIEETGVSAGVLNHPANSVAWLANKLHGLGQALEPGEIVLSGSFIRPCEVARGDLFHADYGPLGAVTCRFV